jgi:putative hydrolase
MKLILFSLFSYVILRLRRAMIYDFHTHTSFSDGTLSPIELIRRAASPPHNYRVIALTDHAGSGSLERIIGEIAEDCQIARTHWDIIAIPGVELTHLPAHAIAPAARRAKELGAQLVIVHGETIVEPVEKGTNLEALKSPDVDILAHPGLLTLEEARLAATNGVFIEISARKGHSLTNGHIALLAPATGIKLLLSSDAHQSSDLLTSSLAAAIIRSTGLEEEQLQQVMSANPLALLSKLPSSGFR